jgi:phosphopentomutase
VPIMIYGPDLSPGSVGHRKSFSDIGQSIAKHLRLSKLSAGKAFSL